MNSSSRSKKSLEKFVNSDKDRNSAEQIIDNLNNNNHNNNKFINNKNQNNTDDYLFEYNISKDEKNNVGVKKVNEKYNSNNIMKELLKEGIISIKQNNNQKTPLLDINNIESVNYEKILTKIISLNRNLNSLQAEKIRLNGQKEIFFNRFNEINQKTSNSHNDLISIPNIKFKNEINNSNKKENLGNTGDKKALIKNYEKDLNFFNDILLDLDGELNILK